MTGRRRSKNENMAAKQINQSSYDIAPSIANIESYSYSEYPTHLPPQQPPDPHDNDDSRGRPSDEEEISIADSTWSE